MKQTEKIIKAAARGFCDALNTLTATDSPLPQFRRDYLAGFSDISMRVLSGEISKREGAKIAAERKAKLAQLLFLKFLQSNKVVRDQFAAALYHEQREEA